MVPRKFVQVAIDIKCLLASFFQFVMMMDENI